jgi:23S rRNA pseudouridine1911/1915/1917 synthase
MQMILMDRLIELFPAASRQTLKRMVQSGRVGVNGRRALRVKQPIQRTDAVVVHSQRTPAADPGLAIVFEDADILVIDKPAGLLTSTGPRERRPTALTVVRNYLSSDRAAKVGLIHRLDREASGLLVFSKSRAAYESLKRQFFNRSAGRVYAAIVSPPPKPPRGRLDSALVEHVDGTVHRTRLAGKGQTAVTEYETLEVRGKLAHLRVTLRTGRKHQIRAHLAEHGSPIVGDTLYGGTKHADGLMLAAIELRLDHPATGKREIFRIPLPDRLARLLKTK